MSNNELIAQFLGLVFPFIYIVLKIPAELSIYKRTKKQRYSDEWNVGTIKRNKNFFVLNNSLFISSSFIKETFSYHETKYVISYIYIYIRSAQLQSNLPAPLLLIFFCRYKKYITHNTQFDIVNKALLQFIRVLQCTCYNELKWI